MAALAVAGAAPATNPVPGQIGALKAIRVALAAGRIDGATANGGRAEISRAAHLVRTLPTGRREHVAVALQQLAAFSGRLTAPRALALIGQLQANNDYFAKHYAPSPKTDVAGADGVIYRYFPGRCLEFHPLANFGALNARVAANDAAGAQQLADALIARGVYQHGRRHRLGVHFHYAGGRAPWLSGMAQAVGAQAFARTAALVPDEATALMREARAAYRAIPGHLLTSVAAGPVDPPLLVPVEPRAERAAAGGALAAVVRHDRRGQRGRGARSANADRSGSDAAELRHRLLDVLLAARRALTARLPAIRRQLLKKLAPADPRFADAATRIGAYEKQPPAFQVANAALGTVRFWLSKPATVQANTAAGPTKRLALSGGWHTLSWPRAEAARASIPST